MKNLLRCGAQKKFLVLNLRDMEGMPQRLAEAIDEAALFVSAERASQDKDPCPEYLVINTDEPYIGEIIDVLKRHGHWGIKEEEPID